MNIELLAAGSKSPAWVAEGFGEYCKRFPRDWQLRLTELPIAKRGRGASVERLKAEEGEKMFAAMKPGAKLIAMDRSGEIWNTEQLARELEEWRVDSRHLQIMIGGPDGLSDQCLAAAHHTWSLSNLTFPHLLVRVIVAEQLYRAWSILNNHPYHK